MKVLLKKGARIVNKEKQNQCIEQWGRAVYQAKSGNAGIKVIDMNDLFKKPTKGNY